MRKLANNTELQSSPQTSKDCLLGKEYDKPIRVETQDSRAGLGGDAQVSSDITPEPTPSARFDIGNDDFSRLNDRKSEGMSEIAKTSINLED